MYCSNCGKQLDEDVKFCPSCGSPVSWIEDKIETQSISSAQSTTQKERGGLILALGILSLFAFGPIFGIPAWVMGRKDLKGIRLGAISSDQKGMTTVGMILGIIGTLAVTIVLVVVFLTVGTFSVISKGYSSQSLAASSPEFQSKAEPLAYYDNIDAIRGQTADETPAIFLLRISLGYDINAKDVSAEIGLSARQIQDLILKYIALKTAAELSPQHYTEIQDELLNQINRMLKTGKVKKIVFREFSVVK